MKSTIAILSTVVVVMLISSVYLAAFVVSAGLQ